jgi:mannose-6-phosphate isomerase-like protein (cupin superfamily)
MNEGTGEMTAKIIMNEKGKIIPCSIHKGGSIGMHRQETSDDINYVLSGNSSKAICDGIEEELFSGACHICPKGSEHSIINTGNEDLVLLTIVIE